MQARWIAASAAAQLLLAAAPAPPPRSCPLGLLVAALLGRRRR